MRCYCSIFLDVVAGFSSACCRVCSSLAERTAECAASKFTRAVRARTQFTARTITRRSRGSPSASARTSRTRCARSQSSGAPRSATSRAWCRRSAKGANACVVSRAWCREDDRHPAGHACSRCTWLGYVFPGGQARFRALVSMQPMTFHFIHYSGCSLLLQCRRWLTLLASLPLRNLRGSTWAAASAPQCPGAASNRRPPGAAQRQAVTAMGAARLQHGGKCYSLGRGANMRARRPATHSAALTGRAPAAAPGPPRLHPRDASTRGKEEPW